VLRGRGREAFKRLDIKNVRLIYHVKVFGCAGATVLCVLRGRGREAFKRLTSKTCARITTSRYLVVLVQLCFACYEEGVERHLKD